MVTSGSLTGNLLVAGGTFAPASLSAGGSLVVSTNMTIAAGTVLVPLNKSLLPQTNITVNGTLTRTGGALVVTNVGPALAANDKFTLFSQPVQNGAALTVSGAGVNWKNDLAVDGSITVITCDCPPPPPLPPISVSGTNIIISWPSNSVGWILQSNSVGLNNSSMWYTVPGSGATNRMILPIAYTKAAVFFRLAWTQPQ